MNKMNNHSSTHIDDNEPSNINLVFKSQLTNDKELRVFGTAMDPWFIGKDIAEFLGYERPRDAIEAHVDKEDKMTVDEFRKKRERHFTVPFVKNLQPHTILINESGLYSLIMRSKLEKAKQFKRWVTSEVLPSIRKTGNYNIPLTLSTDNVTSIMGLLDPLKAEALDLAKNVDRTICAETPTIYLYYIGMYLKLGFSKDTFPIRAPSHQKDDEFTECILVALWNASQVVEQKIHSQLKDFKAIDTKKREVYIIETTISDFIALVDKYINIFTKDEKLIEENKELTHKYELLCKDNELLRKNNELLKKDHEIALLKKDFEIFQLKQSLTNQTQPIQIPPVQTIQPQLSQASEPPSHSIFQDPKSLVLDDNYFITYRNSDKYINILNMCKSKNKAYFSWYRLSTTIKFLDDMKRKYPNEKLIEIVKGGIGKGTWVHRKIAINIAQWISTEYAQKLTNWVENI